METCILRYEVILMGSPRSEMKLNEKQWIFVMMHALDPLSCDLHLEKVIGGTT